VVTRDWFELFVAQNLVFDSLLWPIDLPTLDASIAERHGPGLAMITEFMKTWYDERVAGSMPP